MKLTVRGKNGINTTFYNVSFAGVTKRWPELLYIRQRDDSKPGYCTDERFISVNEIEGWEVR